MRTRLPFCLGLLVLVGAMVSVLLLGLRSHTSSAVRTLPALDVRHRIEYPGCEGFGTELCDIREDSCQSELFGLMRCLYGAGPARPPPIVFVSREVFQGDVRARAAELREQREPLAWAAAELGLHGDLPAPEPGAAEPLVNGYYRPRTGEILMLAERTTGVGLNATLSLAHELVHALQDRDLALREVLESEASRNVDRELALRAAIEGEATAYAEVLQALHAKRILRFGEARWLERLARETDRADGSTPARSSALDAALADFGYAYGAYWAASTLGRGTRLDISAAASDEALDTHALLAARHGWLQRGAPPACSPLSTPLPPATLEASDRLGSWHVQAYVLKHGGDGPRARAAAQAARGDCLYVYSARPQRRRTTSEWAAEAPMTRTLVWDTYWDGEPAARAFADMLSLAQGRQGRLHSLSVDGVRTRLVAKGAPSSVADHLN
jgi:hypothetical protein